MDRYWVGGSASWDGTAGTKWALTSGGAGGQAIPTSADDVFFDAASGVNTVTIATGNTGAKSINCTGFTGTITGTAAITVSGSVTLSVGMTFTYSGVLTLAGTGTLTSAGKTFSGNVSVNGSGITVTLGDALITAGTFNVVQGTFTTNNFNLTAGLFVSNNSNTRTINLGSSTVTVTSNSSAVIGFNTTTNLTLNAGTSTIVISDTSGSGLVAGNVAGPAVTFNNVTFSGAGSGTHSIAGAIAVSPSITINNLSVAAPSTAGVRQMTFAGPTVINGTLSTTGTAGNRRVWIRSQTYGLAHTITVNSAPSLTDADFRDIYVVGTAAPISGTRVGDRGNCTGITFSTPKTVFWVTAAGGNWSGNNWAASSGGGASTDNFPLPQDTATIENTGLNTSATVTLDNVITYTGTVAMGTRTNAMTLSLATGYTVYGNWTNGSGTTLSGAQTLTFSGGGTQNITSAGKTFEGALTIDSYGGAVNLQDAFTFATITNFLSLTVTNGRLVTNNYNITNLRAAFAGSLIVNSVFAQVDCGSSNITIASFSLSNGVVNAGSCTFTLQGTSAVSTSGLVNITGGTFNAGTSSIVFPYVGVTPGASSTIYTTIPVTFYNVEQTAANTSFMLINAASGSVFNQIKATSARTSVGYTTIYFYNNVTVGTFNISTASPTSRYLIYSDTAGTTRTITVQSASTFTNVDFRDITITGAASPVSGTNLGNVANNSGITFPSPKTVYWNLAGAQNWSATGWATSSGGTPAAANFPLSQDTAVFDNTGSAGTVTFDVGWNIGTVDASARTTAMTLSTSTLIPFVYGDWKFGTGVTSSSTTGTITFAKRGTQTITSNGVQFGCSVTVDCVTGAVQLADALSLNTLRSFTLTSGTFDAVTYNVTAGLFIAGGSIASTLKMGSGTWTLTLTGNVWNISSTAISFYKGTANIVLSDTSTSARIFAGNSLSYNKLTIGGATGTSTLTITGNNQFTELASTKTVAHTIALGTTVQTFGKWTVTGTVGNVVTLTGTGISHVLAGACTAGIDYLAMGSIGFAATSPGEFYAGANSTATAAVAPVYLTAKPADSTRYWVGGTGNWSDTARWSTGSGGASGASVPRSHDDVVFDAASNATAYTATVNAVTGGIRTKALTIAGPASGNLTLAGTTAMVGIHNNVSLPATGLTRTYTGAITLSGSTTGRTLTTNGVALASAVTVNGVDCGWSLGSALDIGSNTLSVLNGSFDLATYNLTAGAISSATSNTRTVDFDTGTVTLSGADPIRFGTDETVRANLTVIASTSQINCSAATINVNGNNQTFYNVSFTSTSAGTVTINGANSFNNLSFTGITAAGLKVISLTANQTVTGTLTFSAGTTATMRHFCQSNTIGTTRTITAAAASMTDVDFRDITIAGAAAPASGTRIGDCKGNSGITFTAAKTVYFASPTQTSWASGAWNTTPSTVGADISFFPLAQDTAIFPSSPAYPQSGNTVTISANYNIGTIDMSARTANTMTLATGSTTPAIYGNWINGTGTTLTGAGILTFAGRSSQTITSAGSTFTQGFRTETPGGSVTLQDALNANLATASAFVIAAGTFDANGYNATFAGGASSATSAVSRVVAIGSGTFVVGGTTGWNMSAATNLTVTGTGTISLTSASAKTFGGGGIAYTNITLNQGGAGALTITGNNTFKDITNTYKATGATNITMGTTTQRVSQWTAAGEATRLLTIQGTSATSPCTLVHTGTGTAANVDYLVITGVRAY